MKPLITALKGKGPFTLARRARSIGQRYGLGPGKVERSLEQLSQILQQFDCRATLPVTAVALARNHSIIQKYQARGIEFAIHGYLHVDYSLLSWEEQKAHINKACHTFRDHGIEFEGFRSPYLRWNGHTLTALEQNGVSYDSSTSLVWDIAAQHTTDSYARVLDFYGAQPLTHYLALPYVDGARGLARVPYCLPDDEALVERLKWASPVEMKQVWPVMFHHIHERGELFTLGLHPERVADCSEALTATLQEVRTAGSSVWRAPLAEIAAWWKSRSEASLEVTDIQENVLQLKVSGPPGTTLLLRSLHVETAVETWFDGYQRATQVPCIVRTPKRPFIAVSPHSAPALISFLRQQGYILEVSLSPDSYAVYLDRSAFSREDERQLIAQIEGTDAPLVRLGRWPNGARSALCITGDIDALTLWDYGLRFVGK